jgi:hypothetical protein
MIDDPLSLLSLGIWLMAAGMWPVGFLFGACSACCQQQPLTCQTDWTNATGVTIEVSTPNGGDAYRHTTGIDNNAFCSQFLTTARTTKLSKAIYIAHLAGTHILTKTADNVNAPGTSKPSSKWEITIPIDASDCADSKIILYLFHSANTTSGPQPRGEHWRLYFSWSAADRSERKDATSTCPYFDCDEPDHYLPGDDMPCINNIAPGDPVPCSFTRFSSFEHLGFKAVCSNDVYDTQVLTAGAGQTGTSIPGGFHSFGGPISPAPGATIDAEENFPALIQVDSVSITL